MHVRNVYTSAACNATPESLDWGHNNLIVYAARNAAIVYDPQRNRCVRTVVQHTERVNTVKWVRNVRTTGDDAEADDTFVTGSDDRLCKIHSSKTTTTLAGHEGGVKIVDTLRRPDGALLVATGSADATLKLWLVPAADGDENTGDTSVECYQTIAFTMDLCLAVRLASTSIEHEGSSSSSAVLAIGSGDKVLIYQSTAVDYRFELKQTLCGHEDWVRGLDIVHCPSTRKLLLASSAQDSFIRVWRESDSSSSNDHGADKSNGNGIFTLDSVLSGHDGWVYSVQWSRIAGAAPPARDGDGAGLQLLSSSMDKTMIVWRQTGSDADGIWTEWKRFGDIGGHFLGFFGARIEPNTGRALLGHGHHGSFHLWQQQVADEPAAADADDDDDGGGDWRPQVLGLGGHFGEARGLAWEPHGRFVLSVGADQTTRVHAPCSLLSSGSASCGSGTPSAAAVWHEIARPQVHGYDMQTIAVLSRYRFASGAEEKIVRTFQAPSAFVRSLRQLCDVPGDRRVPNSDDEGDRILKSMQKGATLPSLGLSNQVEIETTSSSTPAATTAGTDHIGTNDDDDATATTTTPPTEETLMQSTLWPETQKLYGHGYEVYSLCATSDGRLLASACKASNTEHAQIILWNTQTWRQHQQLAAHQLTITQMRFSPDDRYLLSVSRDRRWTVFERAAPTDSAGTESAAALLAEYRLLETTNKLNGIHARIIWTCDWSPDSQYFATGSREGKCVMWHAIDELHAPQNATLQHFTAVDVLNLGAAAGDSVTAVAFSDRHGQTGGVSTGYLIAVGCDGGTIRLCVFVDRAWRMVLVLNNSLAHHSTVRRLAFRPHASGAADEDEIYLASCGNDHFVRVYAIQE